MGLFADAESPLDVAALERLKGAQITGLQSNGFTAVEGHWALAGTQ